MVQYSSYKYTQESNESTMKRMAQIEGVTTVISDTSNLLQDKESEEIYKKWMKLLPLQKLDLLKEFIVMLENYPHVADIIVCSN